MNDVIDFLLNMFRGPRGIGSIIGLVIIASITERSAARNQKKYRENKEKNHIICKAPKALLVIGCFSLLPILFFLGVVVFDDSPIWLLILASLFIALPAILIMEVINWNIELFRDKPYFFYRTIFRRTYKIYYDQCQLIHDQRLSRIGNDIVLKVGKKVFYFDKSVSNYYSMIEIMREHKINETWKMRKKRMKKRPKKRKR